MKISVRVVQGAKIFEGEAVLREVGPDWSGQETPSARPPRPGVVKPSEAIDTLYQQGFFAVERDLGGVVNELKSAGCNFSSPSIIMALKAKGYLQRKGSKGSYRFVQKYPFVPS